MQSRKLLETNHHSSHGFQLNEGQARAELRHLFDSERSNLIMRGSEPLKDTNKKFQANDFFIPSEEAISEEFLNHVKKNPEIIFTLWYQQMIRRAVLYRQTWFLKFSFHQLERLSRSKSKQLRSLEPLFVGICIVYQNRIDFGQFERQRRKRSPSRALQQMYRKDLLRALKLDLLADTE